MLQTHISYSVGDPHVRGNNVIQDVVKPQVKEKKIHYSVEVLSSVRKLKQCTA